MKKIAFVADKYCDDNFSTGGQKLDYILIKELKNLGYTIDLYCNEITSIKNDVLNNTLPKTELDNNRKNYDYILSSNGEVASDITYIHGHSYPFRAKYMFNKNQYFLYKIFKKKKHKKRLNSYSRLKNNLNSTKTVVVSSKILKQDMIENYNINPENIVIIPPPIETHETAPKPNNDIFTFGISLTGFARKGGYILFKALKELKKEKKKFKVVLIYPSNNFFVKLTKKLYNIEKYCEFINIQKDMNKFYTSIDCLLMPSIIEPFGMVATEALSNGVPVITSDRCGASDYIKNKENGLVYDATQPVKGLKNAMLEIMSLNETDKTNIYHNCIKSVEDCNEKTFIQKYIELLK